MEEIEKDLESFGFYNTKNKTKQTGIFRTNCIDCLDRTNVVQVS